MSSTAAGTRMTRAVWQRLFGTGAMLAIAAFAIGMVAWAVMKEIQAGKNAKASTNSPVATATVAAVAAPTTVATTQQQQPGTQRARYTKRVKM